MIQHLFVNVFVCLIICMHSHCKAAENETTLSPCLPIRSIDFRGSTGVLRDPGKTKIVRNVMVFETTESVKVDLHIPNKNAR